MNLQPNCLVVLLVVLSAVTADIDEVYNGIGDLSMKLLGATFKNGENTVHSSLSISEALAMCLVGANGPTQQIMKSTMGLGNSTLDRILAGYKLNTEMIRSLDGSEDRFILNEANRLYLNGSFEVRDEFLKSVQDNFKATAEKVDFKGDAKGVRGKINTFVKDATKDLIPEILTEELDVETLFAIVNAVYFKSKWLYNMTIDTDFKSKFNDVSCPGITSSEPKWLKVQQLLNYAYSAEISASLVELPYKSYKGFSASMLFIYPDDPKKCDLASWMKTITWSKLKKSIGSMSKGQIILRIPEVDFEKRLELADVLKSLGMSIAFSDNADFTKMTKPGKDKVKIDRVIHQAKLKIDKQGTVAAAATIVTGIRLTAAIEPEPEIREINLDRGYLAVILLRRGSAVAPIFSAAINKI